MTQTVGEQLKQARQKQGLTLEQVSQATHIRVNYLEALENDQRDALPSAVQGRGFLRLYADHVGLPVKPLLAQWDGKTLVDPVPPGPQPSTSDGAPVSSEPALSPAAEDTTPPPVSDPEPPESAPDPSSSLPAMAGAKQPAGSEAIFREIGRVLRQQRESLGLSIVEVERYTRLRQHYIQALEDGRMEGMPSPVQGRGMLSNYAAFLNLDEETLLLRFAEGLQARRIERLPRSEPQGLFNNRKRPARQAPFWRRFLTPDLVFGIGLAAVILFFILWTAARISSLRAQEAEPTTPAIAAILLTPPPDRTAEALATLTTTAIAPSPDSEITGQATVVSAGEGAPGLETGVPADQVTAVETAVEATSDIQEPVTNQEPVAAATFTLPPINEDPLQVYIVARQRAWLRIVADDKIQFLGRVIPGNAYAFSGEKKVELLTGNAAALQVFYNQMDLGTLGDSGEVIGLIFSPEGMFTPTPAFTATATPTPPATITPLPTATPPATATITPFVP